MLFLDGAYAFRGSAAAVHRARRPSNAELTQLLETLSGRIVRLLGRRGRFAYQYKQPFRDGTHGLRRSVSTSFASRKSYFLRRLP